MTTGITFAAAIDLTEQFVQELQDNQLPPEEITVFVENLVATTESARGFFVGYLTSDGNDQVDQQMPAVAQGLKAHPEIIADLLVKNLAMSTAQQLHFQRTGDLDMAKNSARVAARSRQLIEMLKLPLIKDIFQQLLQSIHTGTGAYVEFLQRWGYDDEQKSAIREQITSFALS
jgi:hypothetical protein